MRKSLTSVKSSLNDLFNKLDFVFLLCEFFTMADLIKLVVDYDYVRDQVKKLISDLDLHVQEHLKILLNSSMRYRISKEERKKIITEFLSSLDKCVTVASFRDRISPAMNAYVESAELPLYEEVFSFNEVTEKDIKVED